MINYNGVELRNLEEQVRKNKEDIAAHYNMDRVLADFGIRILGRVDNYEELLKVPTDNLAYGDAYAVGEPDESGTQTPFVFYIWTRPDPNAGKDEPYWFDMGELSIVGPQGPVGETGPKGDRGIRGSKWFSGSAVPSNPGNYEYGDTYLRSNGDVYQIKENAGNKLWVYATNIRGPVGATGNVGPQGPQGSKGDKGDKGNPGSTGALCNIVGEITSVDQLPTPTPATRYNGYLQEINRDQHLWVVVGPDNDLRWMDVGALGGGGSGTKVIKNGVVLDKYDVSNVVVKNDFSGEGFVFHEGDGIFVTEPRVTKLAGKTQPNIDAVPGRNINGTMDVMTDAAVEEIVNILDSNKVVEDKYPARANEGCLRRNQATPRAYVDALVAKEKEKTIDEAELYVNNNLAKKVDIPTETTFNKDFFEKVVPQYDFTTNKVNGVVPRIRCSVLRKNHAARIRTDYIYYARGAGLGGLTFNYVKDGIKKTIKMTAAIMFPSSSGINGEENRWLFGMLYVDPTGQLQLWNDRIEQNPNILNASLANNGLAYVFSYGMYEPSNPFTDNQI